MGNFFSTSNLLGIVFVGVGIILMVVIAPLVGNAGEQIYASLRAHCERNGERFTQIVQSPSDQAGLTEVATYNLIADGTGCQTESVGTQTFDSTADVKARTPQSNQANLSITMGSAGTVLAKGTDVPNGKWVAAPTIGRTLQGANDVLVALLTPAVLFAILAGMGITAWQNASGNSSEGMMAKFGQQLGGVLGVYVLGIVAPTIIANAGNWFTLTQQQASAGLLRPVYGIVFDLIPMLLIFAMIALAAMPAWGQYARRGLDRVRSRYM